MTSTVEVWLKDNLQRSDFTDKGEGSDFFYDSNAKTVSFFVDDMHTTIFFSNFEQYTCLQCVCLFPLKSSSMGNF